MTTFSVDWFDDERTIIQARFDGAVASWAEQEAYGQQVITLANTVTHTIFVMVTFGPDFSGPPNNTGNAFSSLEQFATKLPRHVAMVIHVNTKRLERILISVFMRVHPGVRAKARFADTLDDAHRIIQAYKVRLL